MLLIRRARIHSSFALPFTSAVKREKTFYTNGYGNRRQHPLRLRIKAVLYRVKTGSPWRQLHHDFPIWKSVYSGYARWCKRGTWEKILDEIKRRHWVQQGRNPDPSCVIIDSPSVKTVSGGDQRGYDGGKKVKG